MPRKALYYRCRTLILLRFLPLGNVFKPFICKFNKAVKKPVCEKRTYDPNFWAWKGEVERRKAQLRWGNRELALHAGLSLSQVNNYMAGNYPNDNPREPIERALGMR